MATVDSLLLIMNFSKSISLLRLFSDFAIIFLKLFLRERLIPKQFMKKGIVFILERLPKATDFVESPGLLEPWNLNIFVSKKLSFTKLVYGSRMSWTN